MAPTRDHMTVLAPEGMLGYGIPVRSMEEGLARNPDVLAVDAGSTDPGPYYLGAGVPYTSRRAVKRDLAMMLDAAHARRIPRSKRRSTSGPRSSSPGARATPP